MRSSLYLVFAFLMLVSFGARAEITPEQLPEVQAAENYLNSITTMKARFVQTAGNGTQAQGNFMMMRPGRMRFEYETPVEDLIVADGTFIYFYDSELKEQKNMPISQSLADFFLRKNLKLAGSVKVTDVKRVNDLLEITVVEAKDPLGGSLTVSLAENPMELKKWRVVDAQGSVTEVELFKLETGISFDRDLFRYYDPNLKKPKYN